MSRLRAGLLTVSLIAGQGLGAETALAYRTLAEELRLPGTVVIDAPEVVLYRVGDRAPQRVSVAELDAAIREASAAWSLECSSLRVRALAPGEDLPPSPSLVVPIGVVSAGWVSRGHASTQAAVAYVKVLEGPGYWSITEGAIALNDDTMAWNSDAQSPDLTAALVHEIGHIIGLGHPCEHRPMGTAPICGSAVAPPSVMHPDHQRGAVSPLDDDRRAVCELYSLVDLEANQCSDAGELGDGGVCGVWPGGCASCGWGACATVGERAGMCIQGGEVGAFCQVGEECQGQACYLSGSVSYCTHACETPSDCPYSWQCRPVEGRRVCTVAPPGSASSCAVRGAGGDGEDMNMWAILALAWLGLLSRRRGGTHVLCGLLAASLTACPAAESAERVDASTVAEDSGMTLDGGLDNDGSQPDAWADTPDSGTSPDAVSGADTGVPTDAFMRPDAPVDAWLSMVDEDMDGWVAPEDCDDSDPAVSGGASRPCSTTCDMGLEICRDGQWGLCSAPTDCSCDTPGAIRLGTCGFCGTRSERCSAEGRWEAQSSCMGSRECPPGAVIVVDRRRLGSCGRDERLCGVDCYWGPPVPLPLPAGRCEWPSLCADDRHRCGFDCLPVEVEQPPCSDF